jgi:hypothetical protein
MPRRIGRGVAIAALLFAAGCAGSMPDPCPAGADANFVFLVVDARGIALAGVEVTASDGDAPGMFVSDEAGIVRIECVPRGSYRLSFAKSGFSTHQMVAEAYPGRAPVLTVYLQAGRF